MGTTPILSRSPASAARKGIPLVKTNGQVSAEPAGNREAGDPLLHEEHRR